jgi:hypothetical protein
MTSRVIAMASTPSLKASSRVLVTLLSSSLADTRRWMAQQLDL